MPGCFIIYIMVMELISEAMGNVKKKKPAFIYFDHYQRFSTAFNCFSYADILHLKRYTNQIVIVPNVEQKLVI